MLSIKTAIYQIVIIYLCILLGYAHTNYYWRSYVTCVTVEYIDKHIIIILNLKKKSIYLYTILYFPGYYEELLLIQ